MISKPLTRPPTSPAINIADIYYIIFRHKWKIVAISALGLLVAVMLPLAWRTPYQSEAKLFIRYVLETKSPGQLGGGSESGIKSPDERGENIINSELEILTSLDLAQQVADAIGPEKILAKVDGKNDRQSAAGFIRRNLTVDVPPKSDVIRLTLTHPDPDMVQPLLTQLVASYLKKHEEIHRPIGIFDDFLTQQTDHLRSRLAQTEQELRQAKTNAGIISLEDAKKGFGDQVSRIRQALFDTESELAERKAAVAELTRLLPPSATRAVTPSVSPAQADGKPKENVVAKAETPLPSATNQASAQVVSAKIEMTSIPALSPSGEGTTSVASNQVNSTVPPDKLDEYRRICTILETLQKNERDLLVEFTPGSTMVKPIEDRITENTKLKRQLEDENPGLLAVAPATQSKSPDPGSGPRIDLTEETAKVIALEAKTKVLVRQLEQIRKEAANVDEMEGSITELQRKKELEEQQYKYFQANLEQARINEALGPGRVSNISTVQTPSPAFRNGTKLFKLRALALFGGIGAGLALAFLIELFLDPSLKRPTEIEGKLGLPLFISIPLMERNGKTRLLKGAKKIPLLPQRINVPSEASTDQSGIEDTSSNGGPSQSTLSPQASALNRFLRPFSEALRDRLVTYFEIKNLTHKPKLVALTSFGEGSGVTTIAAGLAATLSETGEGNVLLVDMTLPDGEAHHFHRGNLKCDLEDALELEKRGSALVQDNLYVVAEATNDEKLPRILPKRFTHLVPKLRVSDYDYIIFDMPPVSQISITPRLARFMDMVLLVVESEKSDRDLVKRGISMISEPHANVGVVLNKRRNYVPKVLQQEL
jgi:uncharacterized protein involved in exopolysaccharide biosynthesis/Mrp family chromosome partitioning ATPase